MTFRLPRRNVSSEAESTIVDATQSIYPEVRYSDTNLSTLSPNTNAPLDSIYGDVLLLTTSCHKVDGTSRLS